MEKEGSAYVGHQRPKLVFDPNSEDANPHQARNTQQDISEAFGLWPVESRELGRYNIFSLFCLMAPDFKTFLRWQDKDDFLDLLFGMDMASAINQSKTLRQNKYAISDEEKTAPEELAVAKSRIDEIEERLSKLYGYKERVNEIISAKKDELRSVNDVIQRDDEYQRLKELESKRLRLERQVSKLESEKRETRGDLRQKRVRIERLEEMQMGEDLHSTAQELQKYMNVPDRCPVCTNDVDDTQRRRLLQEGSCPLCAKPVPTERIEIGSERDVEESIEEQEKMAEELVELRDEERKLEGEFKRLVRELQEKESELERVESQIEDNSAERLLEYQDELEKTVSDLEGTATAIQVEVNANKRELESLEEEMDKLQGAYESRKLKSRKIQALSSFEKSVNYHIEQERASLKNELESEMNTLLKYFKEGSFADADEVTFDSQGGYNFTVEMDVQDDIPSSRHNQNSNEGKILALLFHTTVLKLLSKQSNTIPIRMFLIDSPYSDAPDTGNAPDITRFLSALPDILPDYQIILTVADTSMVERQDFSGDYKIRNFS